MFSITVKSSLSLFCRKYFRKISPRAHGHELAAHGSSIRKTHSRQATLHTALGAEAPLKRTALQVQACSVNGSDYPKGSTPAHRYRSPRQQGRVPHAIGARPEDAGKLMPPPSTHPELGVPCRHKGLHRYALQRIFRPFLGDDILTRILHRRLPMDIIGRYSLYTINIHFSIRSFR